MTQVHLHLMYGDTREITVTSSPTVWLEVTNRAQFDGFYVQIMSGTIHGERHIHYQYMGSAAGSVPVGFSAENLDQYLPHSITSGGILGNPVNPYIAPTFPTTINGIWNNTMPAHFTQLEEEEPPCVCRDPSAHSIHCQYIKWKRSKRG